MMVEVCVKWWVGCNFDHAACTMFRVALWVYKFRHFLEIVWNMWLPRMQSSSLEQGWITEALSRHDSALLYMHIPADSPSYHPECQLAAFPKSFQLLCCTGSVYFSRLCIWVSATWKVFIPQTYLAGWLPYPVISQLAAQTFETSGCWYVSLTFSELIKCLKLF